MMADVKKITKREVINELLKEDLIQSTPMYKNYLTHELELLDRKNASSKTSKTSKENAEIGKMLLEEMAKLEATGKTQYTITELMNSSEVIQNYVCESGKVISNSKISAIFQKMLDSEKSPIANSRDKKISYYSLAK